MNLELQDKVVIVTGGASGIGRGVSEAFAAEGAKVVVTWFESEQGAKDVVSGIEANGGSALAIQADLGAAGEATRVVDTAIASFGQLDVLVTNSGGLLRR
ncbi:MAG: SDR family NAD(P)-dependent oxidoreductase, partial [Thermomicrobiales bacterium]